MRINIAPQQLRAVVAVANDSSFTAAAAKLGLSQPALSRIIQGVEQELGCSIFVRDTRNVSPTAVGLTVLATMRSALFDYDKALANLRDQAAGRSGIVRVATLPSLARALLAPAMVQLRTVAPDVDLHICDALSESVVAQVANGEVDFGLVDQPTGHIDLTYHDLVRDRLGLVCRADDPLAALPRADWTVFAQRPFIAMAVGSSVRSLVDAAFLQAGFVVKPMYEPAFLATVGALVATKAGITALPELATEGLLENALVWLPLDNPTIIRSSGYILRRDRRPQPAASILIELLKRGS